MILFIELTKNQWNYVCNEGDCILGETSAEFEDLYDYMNSLHKILKLNPATIYPGHGPVVKNGEERVRQYIEHRNKRNEQIMEALKSSKEPLNPEELVKIIYVGLNENLIHAAMFNVSNHLSALLKQNRVGMQNYWLNFSSLGKIIYIYLFYLLF